MTDPTNAATPVVPVAPEQRLPDAHPKNYLGLALSGGGFRATLFHLGAIRRLHELGILAKLTTISSVSGGSILNGFLAGRIASLAAISSFDSEVAAPVRAFCSLDIRRWAALERFVPEFDNSLQLAHQYEQHLTPEKLLANIPATPNYIFCTTDLTYGVNWIFTRARCGDYQAGYAPTSADWKLSTAIAASSCFPPVFKPMNLNLDPAALKGGSAPTGPVRDHCIKGMRFSDGGVYDNLGLEPIWKDHQIVLSSDGGALFGVGADTGFAWEVGRFISIPENQALAVRKRWLIAGFAKGVLNGTYWGVGGSPSSYGVSGGYSKAVAEKYIAAIRTDLDSFSDAEASILENHGYWLADAAIKTHVSSLYPATAPAPKAPNPAWDYAQPNIEERIKAALQNSSKRSILGR